MGALIGLDARTVGPTPNGLDTYARQLVRALTDTDPHNSYIILRRPNSGAPIATGPRVREVTMASDPSTPSAGYGIARLGLDLYHSLHHFLPFGLRVPRIVVTLHDLIWLEHPALIRSGPLAPFTRRVTHWYARAAIRYAVERADQIIAISDYTRSRALAYYGLSPARIETVHLAVDHTAFVSTGHSYSPAEPPFFLCLGNSKPYKNIPTAIRAFASCARDIPAVTLVIAGRGDATSSLRRLARELNVHDRVTFTGLVDNQEIVRLLRSAVALVFPSFVEGFGLPVLESMAVGCPVIASDCPTLQEIAGSAALWCDASQTDEFAGAMRRLLDDRALGSDLSRRSLTQAAGFTWTRCAQQTLTIYEALLGAPASDRRFMQPS